MKRNCLVVLAFMLLVGFVACGSDEEQKEGQNAIPGVASLVANATYNPMSEAEMPLWLAEKLTAAKKTTYHYLLPLRVYKGTTGGKTIYFINDPYASCMFCDVYDETGYNFDFSVDDVSMLESVKDWVCIYQYY